MRKNYRFNVRKFLPFDLSHLFLPVGLFFITLLLIMPQTLVARVSLVVFAAISYLLIASFYHFWDKSLTWGVIMEYVLVALLVVVVVSGSLT